MLVDSHCHLNFPDYKDDLDDVIARARAAGVKVMQTICTDMDEFEEVRGIAEKYEGVYCSVGVHPNESGVTRIPSVEELAQYARHPKVIGIGETGLDYHYETSDKKSQHESFRIHIRAAQETGLPLIVHSRDADEDTVKMLCEAMEEKPFKGLIHCFSSTRYLAEKAVEIGLYISLSGIVTFKNAAEVREAAKHVPMDRMLVETDAPYLAPNPHRGKRNGPSYTIYTNKLLAEIKQVSEEECARATTDNFFTLFSKANRL